ncbi:transporter substrate-binding domain-containing protein [Amycolatopsis saalfeldensis]|uniref:Amino acid ABC transporter substrate-binding protein, PAAT family n=1 Tax=Amycolatopsis saalfeldensis TaxID=394193 RepID=A0A1H8UNE1_9PSEU|nr:transporter substrate-binding domain-containing protein [Amycolatopsis saalfeldensis]SEP04537.1 amino acid ABC transporter substrate-binding protein, PAAT family [Amycolatopsis saalfeldensis]
MRTRSILPVLAAVALLAGACGGATEAATSPRGPQSVTVAGNTADANPVQLSVTAVPEIRAKVPKKILDSGKLVIGVGALPSGFPPLAYVGADQRNLTGAEPDLGRLVAAVLGLTPEVQNASWQNLFVRIQSGQFDAGFSNITVTEQRKQQGFDFASYREDNLGFEVNKADSWNFDGNYEGLAGKTVAVDSGTNQEKILLAWQGKLKSEGKKLDVRTFGDKNSTYLALSAHRIDAYFAPNPGIAYHAAQTAKTPNPTRGAGKYSGAGSSLQGLIAATTKKGNGLAPALADAIDYLIAHGQYQKWLAAYGLGNEAVPAAQVNPPGLPLTDS